MGASCSCNIFILRQTLIVLQRRRAYRVHPPTLDYLGCDVSFICAFQMTTDMLSNHPGGWETCLHPEGAPYFYHAGNVRTTTFPPKNCSLIDSAS